MRRARSRTEGGNRSADHLPCQRGHANVGCRRGGSATAVLQTFPVEALHCSGGDSQIMEAPHAAPA
jgi:hypothetical protein